MSRFPSFGHSSLALSLALRAFRTPVCFGTNAIVEHDGTIILVRHRYMPGLCFPGGGVAPGEPPADAILRELKEEIGLKRASAPSLFGLYTRKVGWATNHVALYCVQAAELDFHPNVEISEIMHADPRCPPGDTSPATRRRLAEYTGEMPVSSYW
jgi:8-oxo-dGTP pyrophosphatase MutT (NUDIX family)